MTHQLTITVDEAVYKTLKPMVEQETIGSFLCDFIRETSFQIQNRSKNQKIPLISSLRGTLHKVDTSDIREEADRPL